MTIHRTKQKSEKATKMVTFRIDPARKRKLTKYAEERGTSATWLFERFIDGLVDEKKAGAK